MIYLIKNDEKGYEFETELSEPLTLPEDLANQDSSLWEELREYLRETALENEKLR